MEECREPQNLYEHMLGNRTPVLIRNRKASVFAKEEDKWTMHIHICHNPHSHKCTIKCDKCGEIKNV